MIVHNKSIKFRQVVPTDVKWMKHDFPSNQYMHDKTVKKQICWHHTASGVGVRGDIGHWSRNSARVATPIIVGHDGTLNQLFKSDLWAHHLGVKSHVFKKHGISNPYGMNTILNKLCLGIEIDNWGPLRYDERTDQFFAWPNDYGRGSGRSTVVAHDKVIELDVPYKGHKFYEIYTEESLEASMYLSAFWCIKYGINPDISNNKLFEVDVNALKGKNGIYTHASYRKDKYDLSPQPIVTEYMEGIKDIVEQYG